MARRDGTERGFYLGLSRRRMLEAGALALTGVTLPRLLAGSTARAAGAAPTRRKPAKSCIVFFMEGGPAHQDLWDMKPEAPAEYRGEFAPIPSTIPGVPVCEHLPLLAKQMHRFALIRSVHHTGVDHNAGAYYMLTGRSPSEGSRLIVRDEPNNFPCYGAVLAKLRPLKDLPEFVHLPDIMSNNGHDLPGQRAGFLGAAFDPMVAGDPSVRGYKVPGLGLPADISDERLDRRRGLLEAVRRMETDLPGAADDGVRPLYDKAFTLLTSAQARRAFDISAEPAKLRERYGLPDREDRTVEARKFGGMPHMGQCMLLARRLIEAGVRLVTVGSGRRLCQAWDTHRDHFPLLKRSLCPYTDRGFSALLEDLAARGLLDETLVVAMGEFGRTPKLGQITSGAGAESNGRDHWPHCYSVLMAGGGVRGTALHGASDKHAAFPARDPVTPEDIAATIYWALGIDPGMHISDKFGQPVPLARGRAITGIFE